MLLLLRVRTFQENIAFCDHDRAYRAFELLVIKSASRSLLQVQRIRPGLRPDLMIKFANLLRIPPFPPIGDGYSRRECTARHDLFDTQVLYGSLA